MQELFQSIHFISFVIFFIFIFCLEYLFPLRENKYDFKKRWLHNWSLSFLNTLLFRVLNFATPVWFAVFLQQMQWGILSFFQIPFILEICLTVIILDFCIYLQHVASHKWSWFWRFHQIHHSDEHLDVSTALRFHVWEITISMVYKLLLVYIFWFSGVWLVVFEIILVCSAIFNHANLKLPNFLEKYMSYIFVTPKFHQVHHSVIHTQTDSNYGFFFSFWDRLFHTYTPHNFFVKKLGLDYVKKDLSFWQLFALNIKKK